MVVRLPSFSVTQIFGGKKEEDPFLFLMRGEEIERQATRAKNVGKIENVSPVFIA